MTEYVQVSSKSQVPKAATKPPQKVQGLKVPEKDGAKFSSSWSIPSSYFDEKSNRRLEDGYMTAELLADGLSPFDDFVSKTVKVHTKGVWYEKPNEKDENSMEFSAPRSIVTNEEAVKNFTSISGSIDRKKVYPIEIGRKIKKITVRVTVSSVNWDTSSQSVSATYNGIYGDIYGPYSNYTSKTVVTEKTLTITTPIKPTLSAITVGDAETNHKVSVTIKDTTDSKSKADRYDTEYKTYFERSMYYSYTKNGKKYLGLTGKTTGFVASASGVKTSKEFTVSLKPGSGNVITNGSGSLLTGGRDVMGLRSGEYLKIKVKARNRGMAGDSEWSAEKTYTFAYPHKPVINSITKEGSFYRIKFSTSKENYATDASKKNAVYKTTKFVLQRCSNFRPNDSDDWNDATWLKTVTDEGSFSDVSGKEVGPSERYFLENISDGKPTTDFARTYYRIKAENDVYPAQYSKPFLCPDFKRVPSAANEKVKIIAAGNHDMGNALKVLYVYKVTKTGDYANSNGTELSWSEHEYAWESTENPSTFDAEDVKFMKASSDGNLAADYGVNVKTYPCYSVVYVMGLTPGVEYTLRARRYLDKNRNEKNYGSYDIYADKVMVFKDPGTVDVVYTKYMVEGKDFYLSWIRSSEDEQKKYEVQYADTPDAEGEYYKDNKLLSPKVLMEAESSDEGVLVKYSDYEDKIVEKDDGASVTRSLYLAVRTSTDKRNYALSKPVTISFVKKPEVSISGNELYTAQPLSFTFFTNDPETSLILKLRTYGILWTKPDGEVDYASDEVLYSEKLVPSWMLDSTSSQYYTNVTLPYIPDLVNNGMYRIEATVVNEETGMSSETYDDNGEFNGASWKFDVFWAHPAGSPGSRTYAVKVPGSESVYIYPDYPENYVDGDVCDIYRVTPDGAVLAGEDLPFGKGVYDAYAPFTNQAITRYLVCTRTVDGDISWKELAYYYHGHCIRFDWLTENGKTQNTLSLPYNLTYSDSYEKQFESRMHMDGSNDGYWQPGIRRTGSFSTDIIRLEDPHEKELVRELARYSGPVYVRRPDGCAYTANVTVNTLPNDYKSLVMTVSIDVEEITMSEQFKIS